MSKNKYDFPLSFDEIGSFLKNEHEALKEVQGIIIIPKNSKDIEESIRSQVFKNVFDDWNKGSSHSGVVVGNNKLLCEVNVESFEILEEAPTIQNLKVLFIKANLKITADPGYTSDVETEVKFKKKNKL